MASEIKVDTVSEKTSANGITIDGLNIKDAKLATANSVVETNMSANSVDSDSYVDGSIDNAHIADDAIDSEHYAAGSIDTAHIADNQITLAKLAGGTDGNIISFDASGDPVAIATGSDGQVLTSTGAGSPPAFEAVSGGLTVVDSWRFTTNASGDVDPFSANLERNDTAGFSHLVGMAVSSGVWTFPSTGFYLVTMSVGFDEEGGGAEVGVRCEIEVTTDNSSYGVHGVGYVNFASGGQGTGIASSIIDVTDTDNVKVKFKTVNLNASNRVIGNSTQDLASFKFIRLGDT